MTQPSQQQQRVWICGRPRQHSITHKVPRPSTYPCPVSPRKGGILVTRRSPTTDLIYIGGAFSHLDVLWEFPPCRRFCEQLASFSRLIDFDKRGMGLSDHVQTGTLEERMMIVRLKSGVRTTYVARRLNDLLSRFDCISRGHLMDLACSDAG